MARMRRSVDEALDIPKRRVEFLTYASSRGLFRQAVRWKTDIATRRDLMKHNDMMSCLAEDIAITQIGERQTSSLEELLDSLRKEVAQGFLDSHARANKNAGKALEIVKWGLPLTLDKMNILPNNLFWPTLEELRFPSAAQFGQLRS